MTYGQFLAVFLVVPLVVLVWYGRRMVDRALLLVLCVLSLVALIYTAPWDNWIVVHHVWSYPHPQILGVVIGHVPLEEYVFYVLQVFLTGVVTVTILGRAGERPS